MGPGSESGAVGGQYKRTPRYFGAPSDLQCCCSRVGWSLGHRCTRWAGGQLHPLPAPPCRVWPARGSPKPGLWRDQRVLGKGPELVEASTEMEQLLVITCSSPGSPPLSCLSGIFLSWSEHLKASWRWTASHQAGAVRTQLGLGNSLSR